MLASLYNGHVHIWNYESQVYDGRGGRVVIAPMTAVREVAGSIPAEGMFSETLSPA